MKAISLISVIAGFLYLATTTWAAQTSAASADMIGSIIAVEGAADITSTQNTPKRPATLNTLIYNGDTINTNLHARALIVLADGTQITLGAASSLTIKNYAFYGSGAPQNTATFACERGTCQYSAGDLGAGRTDNVHITLPIGQIDIGDGQIWTGPQIAPTSLEHDDIRYLYQSRAQALIRTPQGRITLPTATGTTIRAQYPPTPPAVWDDKTIAFTHYTIALDKPLKIAERIANTAPLRQMLQKHHLALLTAADKQKDLDAANKAATPLTLTPDQAARARYKAAKKRGANFGNQATLGTE